MNYSLLDLLTSVDLIVSPPRVRTIFYCRKPVRLAFPWVTIGYWRRRVHVFFHNEPLKELADAEKLWGLPPDFFHLVVRNGEICVEDNILWKIVTGEISAADAFWLSDNHEDSLELLPRAMFDVNNPKEVLKVEWAKPYWYGAGE